MKITDIFSKWFTYAPDQTKTRIRWPLLFSLILFNSGCALTELKQREAALNDQQQALNEQLQQLEKENRRLAALESSLGQEQKRLDVLKKSLNAAQATEETSSRSGAHIIIGELEPVYLTPPNIELVARIDTGAKTSSLNALDMVEFERDGKAHVRFNIIDPDNGQKIEIIRRIVRHVKIKEHQGEASSRPVVKMRVRLGNIDQPIKMTLTDRSEFKNQVLIGRNFLRDFAIVDVSQKFSTKPVIDKD